MVQNSPNPEQTSSTDGFLIELRRAQDVEGFLVKNESVVKGSDVVNERLQISPEKVFCEDAKVNKLDGIFVFGEKSEVFGFFERFGQQIP